MSEIEAILSKLDPKTRQRLKNGLEIETKRLKTASVGLNLALNGGLGFGRQTLFYGNKSAGKSSVLLQTIGLAQKEGLTAAWIDAERCWDKAWADRMGVNNDEIIISRATSINQATEDAKQFIEAGIDIIVVDSVSALLPSAFFDKNGELSEVNDSKQLGSQAKDIGVMSTQLCSINDNTALIFISQHTTKINQTYVEYVPHGGEKIRFNSSTIIRLTATEGATSGVITGKINRGDKIFEDVVGREVSWVVKKNKMAPQDRSGNWNFYFDGDNVGIDNTKEILDYAEKFGIIEKGGSWYKIYGESFQGDKKATAYLRDNPEIFEKVRDELYAVVN